jgi:hypothetical protein
MSLSRIMLIGSLLLAPLVVPETASAAPAPLPVAACTIDDVSVQLGQFMHVIVQATVTSAGTFTVTVNGANYPGYLGTDGSSRVLVFPPENSTSTVTAACPGSSRSTTVTVGGTGHTTGAPSPIATAVCRFQDVSVSAYLGPVPSEFDGSLTARIRGVVARKGSIGVSTTGFIAPRLDPLTPGFFDYVQDTIDAEGYHVTLVGLGFLPPDTDQTVYLSCDGDRRAFAFRVPKTVIRTPVISVPGPRVFDVTGPGPLRLPVTATAVGTGGVTVPVTCLPRRLPQDRTTVITCATTAAGPKASVRFPVIVRGVLGRLGVVSQEFGQVVRSDALAAREALATGDRLAATRSLSLLLDDSYVLLNTPGLRQEAPRIALIADLHLLPLHRVLPGEHLWQIVRDTLERRFKPATPAAIAAIVATTVLANNLGPLLRPGQILAIPV